MKPGFACSRMTIVALILAAFCAGCQTWSVGASSGGMGMRVSGYGDFLYSGPSDAYSTNREAMQFFLERDWDTAEKLFRRTLERHPGNPDATFYLGLTLIARERREAGYAMLDLFRDPLKVRVTQEVRWWADYCRRKPQMTPDEIINTMRKARGEGFERDRQEEQERRRLFLDG